MWKAYWNNQSRSKWKKNLNYIKTVFANDKSLENYISWKDYKVHSCETTDNFLHYSL